MGNETLEEVQRAADLQRAADQPAAAAADQPAAAGAAAAPHYLWPMQRRRLGTCSFCRDVLFRGNLQSMPREQMLYRYVDPASGHEEWYCRTCTDIWNDWQDSGLPWEQYVASGHPSAVTVRIARAYWRAAAQRPRHQ